MISPMTSLAPIEPPVKTNVFFTACQKRAIPQQA